MPTNLLPENETDVVVLPESRIAIRLSRRFGAIADSRMDPLPVQDEEKFQRCHLAILQSEISKLAAALALKQIRDNRLYRGHFGTFREYCNSFAAWSKSYAYDLIAFGEIVCGLAEEMSAFADKFSLPTSEAQTRPLRSLAPPDRVTVWKMALRRKSPIVTMRVVKEAREEFLAAHPSPQAPSSPRMLLPNSERLEEGIKLNLHLRKDSLDLFRLRAAEAGTSIEAVISAVLNKAAKKAMRTEKKASTDRGPELFAMAEKSPHTTPRPGGAIVLEQRV